MRAISRARWDALAAYARHPIVKTMSQELGWFESRDGRVIATLIIDTDGEFSCQVLARDLAERFRWVTATGYFDTPEDALVDLHRAVADLLPTLDEARRQGDEPRAPVDFFSPVVAEQKLHPNFRRLASDDGFSAARNIIGEMMRWHEDVDGNFIEQFQTTGFDARMWELYLFAVLTEADFTVTHPKPAPDFLASGPYGEFAMEATTINPSIGGAVSMPPFPAGSATEDDRQYHENYLPIRYAGPLTTKLSKEYWKRPAAHDKPLVFAIQDFHAPLSMTYSGSALSTYLYGIKVDSQRDENGHLIHISSKIAEHRWGDKVIQSGFFSLPGAENVSAVLFNSAGTVSKFNRMGVAAGFGADNITLVRRGFAWNPDPDASDPARFVHVAHVGYPETWIEGMDVFHNPNALHPFDSDFLPMAAHHRMREDGLVETTSVGWKPIASTTGIVTWANTTNTETAFRDGTA